MQNGIKKVSFFRVQCLMVVKKDFKSALKVR